MKLFVILLSFCLLTSCAKEIETKDCQKLENGLVINNADEVKVTLQKIIGQSLIRFYTRTNLERIAELLSSQCDVEARLLCFSCIETLPEQSEMELEVSSGGTIVRRVVDISYNNSNEIVIVGMHD